jgi:hypothetical protein
MKPWQFWLLFLAIFALNLQVAGLNLQVVGLRTHSEETFRQARWITWKLDQSGAERISVKAAP